MKINDLGCSPYIPDLGAPPKTGSGDQEVTTLAAGIGEESGGDWCGTPVPGSDLGEWIRANMPPMPTLPGYGPVTLSLGEDA